MSSQLRSNNTKILQRGRLSTNQQLRARLHALKVGECIITTDPDAQRLAASLSRSTKRTSGTTYATRTVPGGVEIQLIKYHDPRRRTAQVHIDKGFWPVPEKVIETPEPATALQVLPPPPTRKVLELDASDVMELNALRDLFNGFVQRLELKNNP